MNSLHPHAAIEPLETRIAPATLTVVSPTMATYTDVDGDFVTVKSSKPILDDLDFIRNPGGLGDQLLTLDLSDDGTAADGTNLSIIAQPQGGKGDGFVNVGYINASGRVLGNVRVDGDLGAIDVGKTATNPFALQSLTVQSLGEFGTATGAPADLQSDIVGSVKSITVKGDVRDVFVSITGATGTPAVNSSLGALTIGGSLLGTTATGFGSFNVAGNIGPVKIGGSVVAGPTQGSGQIGSINGSIGKVTIGGDVRGGGTAGGNGNSGFIATSDGSMGNVKIGGSLIGGASVFCGSIGASTAAGTAGSMGKVTIGRDVIGGTAANTARVSAADDIGAVFIGGSLIGGTAADAGLIASGGALGAVKIVGDLEGGAQARTGWIHAEKNISSFTIGRSITIGGDVIGGSAGNTGYIGSHPKTLTIRGSYIGGTASDSGELTGSWARS